LRADKRNSDAESKFKGVRTLFEPAGSSYHREMGRPQRADHRGGIYHALNRGNGGASIFRKPDDFDAFEEILAEGLARYPCNLFAYQLMPDHWHLVLRPTSDGGMSDFLRWVSLTHSMRLHAHYQTLGEGHVYQGRFKSFPVQKGEHFLAVCRYVERNALRAKLVKRAEDWKWGSLSRSLDKIEREPRLLSDWPVPRPPRWKQRVNVSLADAELQAIRQSVNRGTPFGDERWVAQVAHQFGLESTLRPRGRPRKAPVDR
jgi:putative transposase